MKTYRQVFTTVSVMIITLRLKWRCYLGEKISGSTIVQKLLLFVERWRISSNTLATGEPVVKKDKTEWTIFKSEYNCVTKAVCVTVTQWSRNKQEVTEVVACVMLADYYSWAKHGMPPDSAWMWSKNRFYVLHS